MINNQITISLVHGYDDHTAEGSNDAVKKTGMCAGCGMAMLSVSVLRHVLTACAKNPNRLWYQCHQCPRVFTRKDALKRHLAAPQACPRSRRAAISLGSDMDANPSRTVRARTTRRAAPYVPSPASSSSFNTSRRQQWGVYSLGFSESAISPVVSTLRPISSTAGPAPVVEPRSWTQLPQVMDADTCDGAPEYLTNFISPPTQSSARTSQHDHLFDQRHTFSFPQITPTDGLSQISKVPSLTYYPHTPTGLHTNDALLKTVPSAYPSSSWDSSSLTGDSLSNPASQLRGVRFFDISAGFIPQDLGRSQAVTEPHQSAPANYYRPFAIQGWAAPGLQGLAHPQIGDLGERAVFHVQSSSGGLQSQQIPRQAAPIPRRHNPHHRPHLLRDAPYPRGAPLPYPGRSLSNSQL